MKKKIALLSMILAAVLALTGCMEANLGVNFNLDNSITLSHEFYFTEESESIKGELSSYMTEEGYTITDVEKNGQAGIRGERVIPANQKPLTNEELKAGTELDPFQISPTAFGQPFNVLPVKKLFSTTYVINQSVYFSSAQLGNPTISLTVSSPKSPAYSNADQTANFGHTQTWVIAADQTNYVQYAVDMPNLINIAIAVGIVVLLALIVLLIVLLAKRKKNNIENEIAEGELDIEFDGEATGEADVETDVEPTADAPVEEPVEEPIEKVVEEVIEETTEEE